MKKHDVVLPNISMAQDISHLWAGLHKADDLSVARVAFQPLAVLGILVRELAFQNLAYEQASVFDPRPHQIGALALEEPVLGKPRQCAEPGAVGVRRQQRGGVQNCRFAHHQLDVRQVEWAEVAPVRRIRHDFVAAGGKVLQNDHCVRGEIASHKRQNTWLLSKKYDSYNCKSCQMR